MCVHFFHKRLDEVYGEQRLNRVGLNEDTLIPEHNSHSSLLEETFHLRLRKEMGDDVSTNLEVKGKMLYLFYC